MNKFSYYIIMLIVATATLFSSCEKDEIRATFTLSQSKIFFSELDDVAVIPYTGTNIVSLTYDSSDLPDGWRIDISRGRQTITVYGPTTEEDFLASLESETITFTATSVDDLSGYDYLTVGTSSNTKIDLSDQQANSFIVTKPDNTYSFNAMTKGEGQGELETVNVEILWQTYPTPLSFSRLVDGNAEFHVAIDDSDIDEDGQTDDLLEGNALIVAYNASGKIIWSWHIWITDYAEEDRAVQLNNTTIMSRNLGAKMNSTSNEDSILDSYGLYYQWGRKEPFVGAYYYNAAGATDATMISEAGKSVTISYVTSTSSTGKESYATQNPLSFIMGVEASSYDWLYSDHSDERWSSEKSVNDPCPKGWKVASPDIYSGLKVPSLSSSEMDEIANKYGWLLSDQSGNSELFMGLGRRTYITGKIHNYNLNEERPAPWVGYYWSNKASSSTGDKSNAMYFSFDQEDPAGNTIQTAGHYRANGMQVRCQRDSDRE